MTLLRAVGYSQFPVPVLWYRPSAVQCLSVCRCTQHEARSQPGTNADRQTDTSALFPCLWCVRNAKLHKCSDRLHVSEFGYVML